MSAKCRQSGKIKGPRNYPRSFFCVKLAGAGGFEPPATGFGDQRSGQTELRSCDMWRPYDVTPILLCSGFWDWRRRLMLNGALGGIRTPDARLRTPPLYPLSYKGIMVEIEGLEPSASALRTPRSPN